MNVFLRSLTNRNHFVNPKRPESGKVHFHSFFQYSMVSVCVYMSVYLCLHVLVFQWRAVGSDHRAAAGASEEQASLWGHLSVCDGPAR